MAEKKRLNVDIPRAISDFEAVVKEFELKEKIYRIIYRGKGLEFEGYRDYAPDDDAADIDWKASGRANKLITRKYKEERDLAFVFVVDVGDNMLFGSTDKLKCENAAEMISAISHLIVTSNDRVGVVLFSDEVKEYISPKGGLNQLYLIADKLADPDIYGGGSDLNKAFKFILDYLNEEIDAVIIVSDFIKMRKTSEKDLILMPLKFETTAMMVKDPLDIALPDVDKEIVIEDPVTKQQLLINPKMARKIYERNASNQEKIVKEAFLKSNIDLFRLVTDKYFVIPLAIYLKERVEKRGLAV